MRKNKKMKKVATNKQQVISALAKSLNDSKYLYNTNKVHISSLKRNGDFISNILNEKINDIFYKLDNVYFTFKYQIYKSCNYQPSFLFHKKDDLKKFMLFNGIDDYKYNVFGIRLEFIDPASNRYIYIITIE